MRIKKLELNGFKSFKDRTVIHFDHGITGIVGPNGCGKSNIVDALVWVMGEMSAKHLRGSNMSDVIFSGTEGYAPMGMAEVSLTLENDGGPFPTKYLKHSEVMVTRRLHRSGESEYLVNKEPARLRDIQEIFMDTGAGAKGFSIIEQGKIGEMITAKPEQRRRLIEEVAGITKFKIRKRESQRKLVSTDQNLVRLQDIIGEQKRQLDSLQRQAKRAERYRNLKLEMQDKEIWLASHKYVELKNKIDEAREAFNVASEGEISSGTSISQLENELQEVRLFLSEQETSVNTAQHELSEKQIKIRTQENAIREYGFEVEQARRNKEMAGSFVNQHEMKRSSLSEEKSEMDLKLSELRQEAEDLKAEFEKENTIYQETQQRISDSDMKLTARRKEMLTVGQGYSHIEAQKATLEAQIVECKERVADSEAVFTELQNKQTEFEKRHQKLFNQLESEKQMQLDLMKDIDSFEANLKIVQEKLEVKDVEVASFKDTLNEVTGRLYGLENLQSNYEGFQEGVKNIMLWQRQQKMEVHADGSAHPVYQPMAEIIEVPEKYEMAMEAALGTRLQTLLSTDQSSSIKAVDYLKNNQSGRSSFLSADLGSVQPSSSYNEVSSEPGYEAFLSDVVSVPDKYKNQVGYFLNDVVIVDSIRTALNMRGRYENKTFVTLEGDTLSADGVLTGGASEDVESGVLKRRREIKELSMQREEAAGKLSLAQAAQKTLKGQFENLKQEFEQAKIKTNEKEVQLAELRKDVERSENEFENSKQAVNRQRTDLNDIQERESALNEKLTSATNELTELKERQLSLETEVVELDKILEESKQGIGELQERTTNLQVRSAARQTEVEGLEAQIIRVSEALSEVEEQLGQMSEESSKNTQLMTENQKNVEESKLNLEKSIRDLEASEAHVARLKDDYEKSSAGAREKEKIVSNLLRERNEAQARINETQLKLEQFTMKEQYLIDQINERYMLDIREAYLQHKDVEGDVDATEIEVNELKTKLGKIGEVNLAAIEEYDDLIERYEFLKQQHEDLTSSKDQLRRVIDRINRICSKRFRETFEQVNERFVKVFPVLFGGGEARLILVDYPDKDEDGVDIVARPPGKKPQSISLLSGGEKALTAVSLIFSIFLVKPSPFCLLDEVDAPLDDANVFRFNDLVREMAKRSQIIVVTHNKHTMKVNNKLFGVTQEEKGVSKMVTVSLDDAQKVAGT